MIVPSMNSEELANEVLSDYDSVLRKVKYLIAALRRDAIKDLIALSKYNNWDEFESINPPKE